MEATKFRHRYGFAASLNRSSERRVFCQSEMGPIGVVVIGVLAQQSPQMAFAQNDDMVEQIPPDRSDDTLDVTVLPGRPRCGGPVTDTDRR